MSLIRKYKITNYGNTRSVYIKGQTWEVSRQQTITITSKEVKHAKEVADAFDKLPFVDVIRTLKRLKSKKKTSKKKASVRKTKKKKVTTQKNKKMKRSKHKRRSKK